MAYLRLTAKAPSGVNVPAGSAKTILQITAPTNQALTLWASPAPATAPRTRVSPGCSKLCRQSTAGTMAGSVAPVMSPISGLPETIQSTSAYGASVEPATGDIVWSQEVHPQSGKRFDFAFDKPIRIPGGGRLASAPTSRPASISCPKWTMKSRAIALRPGASCAPRLALSAN